MEERNYWIGFSVFPGIGPARFQTLLKTFGSAKDAWHASRKEIEKALGPKLAEHFETFRSNFSLEQYTKRVEEKNVWFVTLTDSEYPQLLKQIPNPPFVLYGKGDLDCLYSSSEANAESRSRRSSEEGSRQARTIKPTIGVVGTRKITSYGEQVTRLLTQELVQAGCVIMSGLAMGVDAVAHTTTVENGGKTIAVLGCGVDCCFPATNQNVYDSILESGGCIVSEYPLSAQPTKGSFPSRNRIIAGLSQGVLVTEGAEDSGALITASNAASLKRPVFAVPGQITSSLSKGPFALLSKGAHLVTESSTILQVLGINHLAEKIKKGKIKGENADEQKIIDLLQNESMSFDELVKKTKIDSSKMGALLSLMEVRSVIRSNNSSLYSLA